MNVSLPDSGGESAIRIWMNWPWLKAAPAVHISLRKKSRDLVLSNAFGPKTDGSTEKQDMVSDAKPDLNNGIGVRRVSQNAA
jgi:hypothetical protein